MAGEMVTHAAWAKSQMSARYVCPAGVPPERGAPWIIAPGTPTQDVFAESFNGRRRDGNTVRPHAKLGGKTSAEVAGQRAPGHAPGHVAINLVNQREGTRLCL